MFPVTLRSPQKKLQNHSSVNGTRLTDCYSRWGMTRVARSLSPNETPPTMDKHRIYSDIRANGYVRIDALQNQPRGKRDWAVFIVLGANSRHAKTITELKKLLKSIHSEPATKDNRLDEMIIIAPEDTLRKTHYRSTILHYQSISAKETDLEGGTFYNAYTYDPFIVVVPENLYVPKHRILSKEETEKVVKPIKLADKNVYSYQIGQIELRDPAIVWLGGRVGEYVAIKRNSFTTGHAIAYRKIIKGAFV
ncbi:DNA-directed RNA polymerase subunit H [Rhizophagus irregularis DAOM 181602=DAOM 197198]|nr:DNA-directed RNA polymerase subunit H [Rhizophagus irregularis DAOM 181602=DAOM 197198]